MFDRRTLMITLMFAASCVVKADPVVIAHRGASGYLHEHTLAAKDLARSVLAELRRHGCTSKESPVYLQSFDYHELLGIKQELQPRMGMQLRLVQPFDYAWMHGVDGVFTGFPDRAVRVRDAGTP